MNLVENNKPATSLINKQEKSLDMAQVSKIFLTLRAVYGKKFLASFQSSEQMQAAQAIWSEALWFLNEDQVNEGLSRCIHLEDWDPNIPQFIRLATGLPDKNEAVARVLSGNTPDEVSYRIRKGIGSWDIGHQTQATIKTRVMGMYDDIYMEVIEEIGEDHE